MYKSFALAHEEKRWYGVGYAGSVCLCVLVFEG